MPAFANPIAISGEALELDKVIANSHIQKCLTAKANLLKIEAYYLPLPLFL